MKLLPLLVGFSEAFAPNAFLPRRSLSLHVATDPTAAVANDNKLGLEHPAISPFGKGQDVGSADKELLGGKGANLAVMTSIGLSVPPGFTITTECCDRFCNAWNMELPDGLWSQVESSLKAVEEEMNAEFGSPLNPLLLSVRSGAAISMPVRTGTLV
jgi:pyruvate,orthophosphate dikinase